MLKEAEQIKTNNDNNNNNNSNYNNNNSESVRVNETHKIFKDFEIETDYLIPARRPDLVIVNNKKENPAE